MDPGGRFFPVDHFIDLSSTSLERRLLISTGENMEIIILSAPGRPSIFLSVGCSKRSIVGEIFSRYGAQLSPDGQFCVPHSWIARI
jgi:hypothetical protein